MLKLQNICVKYSYKTVLTDVSISFSKGKIYSLLGENGAGKSTLAHIICGDKKQTSGKIFLEGKEVSFSSPKQALNQGICCVHQRPLLAPSISIKENLIIGQSNQSGLSSIFGLFKKSKFSKELDSKIQNLLNYWLPGIKSNTLIKDLNQTELFFVSLISSLLKNPKILILDEPAALPFEKIQNLAASGITILIITHSIKEALTKTNKIVLLKNGVIIDKLSPENTNEQDIKSKLYTITKEKIKYDNISKIKINEEDFFKDYLLSKKNSDKKIGYIPSDKTFRASNPNLTILQLLTAHHTKGSAKELKTFASNILENADVNIKLDEKVYCLSGGMLQRLILERELAENPDLLVLFHPTHGLDIEAKNKLFDRLNELRKNGTSVIIGQRKGETK